MRLVGYINGSKTYRYLSQLYLSPMPYLSLKNCSSNSLSKLTYTNSLDVFNFRRPDLKFATDLVKTMIPGEKVKLIQQIVLPPGNEVLLHKAQ